MRTGTALVLLLLIGIAVLLKVATGDDAASDDGTTFDPGAADVGTDGTEKGSEGTPAAKNGEEGSAGVDLEAQRASAADLQEGRRLLTEAEKGADRDAITTKRQEARIALSRAMEKGLGGEAAVRVRADLDRLFQQTIRLDRELPGVTFRHRVAPGERLWNLCSKAGAPFRTKGAHLEPGFVLWVNDLRSARNLRAGMHLTVPIGSFRMVVDKSAYTLRVFYGEGFVKEYRVGLGRDDKTPEGEFVVETKLEKPEWTSPEGRIYPYGDAKNPLGTRWLGFRNSPRASGYGVHGTDDPSSIGGNASNGCIRMMNADVEELFSWVPRSATVVIRR